MSSGKLSGSAERKKRTAGIALGDHPKPPGKVPRGKEWDYVTGGWKPILAGPSSSPSELRLQRGRDVEHAKELFGLHVDVPIAAFGGDWATCIAT